jgi:glycosyltransferase involved in cell wall biosynthesis
MAEPLISVITPTWQRGELVLARCIPSVLAQDYPAVQHIVVSDGPDPDLGRRVALSYPAQYAAGRIMFAALDDHDPGFRWGHRARLRGLELAAGDVIAYLDDDNAFRPNHLSAVTRRMFEQGADFAYSQALFHGHGDPYVIGASPPFCGGIDTSVMMHRRSALDLATWRDEGQETVDWDLAERWLNAGAVHAFHPEVTVDYHFSR